MYKTRGRPEDPWNLAAAEQNKNLAAAIHVNQINKNGVVPHTRSDVANRIQRNHEFARRRQNYQEFKEKYHDKIKPSNILQDSRALRRSEEIDYQHDVQVMKRFVGFGVNGRRSDNPKGRQEPAMLRAPLRAAGPAGVHVAGRYSQEPVLCPPKFGEGESLQFYRKIKEMEHVKEKVHGILTAEHDTQTNLVKEVQDRACIEEDIGNAQLEEINRILLAKRAQKAAEEASLMQKSLYRVHPNFSRRITASEKDDRINKKTKFLLTLNDVHERIQKLQVKFFNSNRLKYKSVIDTSKAGNPQSVEVLYKNKNYEHDNKLGQTSVGSQEESMRLDLSSLEQSNINSHCPHTNQEPYRDPEKHVQFTEVQNVSVKRQENPDSIRPYTAEAYKRDDDYLQQKVTNRNLLNKKMSLREDNNLSRSQMLDQFEISNAHSIGDHAQRKDFLSPNGNISYDSSYVIEDYVVQTEAYQPQVPEEAISATNNANVLIPDKLHETIMQSNFLMKEFEINPKDIINICKPPPAIENKGSRNYQPYVTPLQKLRKERVLWDNDKVKNLELYAPVNAMLKNTLYCSDEP